MLLSFSIRRRWRLVAAVIVAAGAGTAIASAATDKPVVLDPSHPSAGRDVRAGAPSTLSLDVASRSCASGAELEVSVDGRSVASAASGTVTAPGVLAKGKHVVGLRLRGAKRGSKCRVTVSHIQLTAATATPTATATPSPTPTPTPTATPVGGSGRWVP